MNNVPADTDLQPALPLPAAHYSLVIPVFNEEPSLQVLYERTAAVIAELPGIWELIFVDDGSGDGSTETLARLRRNDPRIKILRFSRNFGAHIAVSAGLDYAAGAAVIVMTSDLQEPPEFIPQLLQAWRSGYEIVWGVRGVRGDNALSGWISRLYWRVFKGATELKTYPEQGVGGLFLLDQKVLRVLRTFRERNRQLTGILAWTGFRQTEIPYRQEERLAGRSKWSFDKKVKLAIDSLVSFSYIPIRFMIYLGLFVSLVSFAYAIFVSVSKLIGVNLPAGWPTVMASILFLGGVQLTMLGILGEYLWRTLEETRQRPLYVITEAIGFPVAEPTVRPAVDPGTCGGPPATSSTIQEQPPCR